MSPEALGCCCCGCDIRSLVDFSCLEARLDEIERVADYDACGAGDVAGPEVCGHGWAVERGGLGIV